ncbi:MAG TPA: Xaa-Pro peptidase family protein [Clostridia bacterium]|nr:Xaa-Pro peptidase family protein [Clostridia bacterium]
MPIRKRYSLSVFALIVLMSTTTLALDRQPNSDYRARRMALASRTKGAVVLMFAATESEGSLHGFRQDNNFFYLSGWAEPGAALVIAPEVAATPEHPARPYTEILFLPAHNVSQEKWTGPTLGPENSRASEIAGFARVEVLDKLRDELVKVLPQPRALVLTDLAEAGENSPATIPLEWLRRANTFPNYGSVQDVKALLAEMRAVKDAGEQERIRKATEASKAAHLAALKAIKPGVTELQISGLMQYEFMKRGCERPAYAPIVGSGINSTVLHYADNSKTIDDGDLVVMDVAGEYSMYASDITRTAPANGKFTPRQREIYDIVLGAQRAVMDAFVAGKSVLTGNSPESLYKTAYDYINTHGKDLHGQPLGKYFIHGLGHNVGLEVHDPGRGPLSTGMVFTIEPGIYIPEEKLGVRIENIVLVGPDGKLVNLTADLPHTADEIEAAMER